MCQIQSGALDVNHENTHGLMMPQVDCTPRELNTMEVRPFKAHNTIAELKSTANKWGNAQVPAPANVSNTPVQTYATAPAKRKTETNWTYTKGCLMTIEGSRLKALMIQALYNQAKESEAKNWSIKFSRVSTKEALVVALKKAVPTFSPENRSKFPDPQDEAALNLFFSKIKANFEKGRLRTYMREQSINGDPNVFEPPMRPEGPPPDLQMSDSKIIHHKTWLQNYAWFVCVWIDRTSTKQQARKRASDNTNGSSSLNGSPMNGSPAPMATPPPQKRVRTSLGSMGARLQHATMDHFASTMTGNTIPMTSGQMTAGPMAGGTITGGQPGPTAFDSMQSLGASNLEPIPSPMMHHSTGTDEIVHETLQFGLMCLFSMVAAANSASMNSMNRMRMVAHGMAEESRQRRGPARDSAQRVAKNMQNAIDSFTNLY